MSDAPCRRAERFAAAPILAEEGRTQGASAWPPEFSSPRRTAAVGVRRLSRPRTLTRHFFPSTITGTVRLPPLARVISARRPGPSITSFYTTFRTSSRSPYDVVVYGSAVLSVDQRRDAHRFLPVLRAITPVRRGRPSSATVGCAVPWAGRRHQGAPTRRENERTGLTMKRCCVPGYRRNGPPPPGRSFRARRPVPGDCLNLPLRRPRGTPVPGDAHLEEPGREGRKDLEEEGQQDEAALRGLRGPRIPAPKNVPRRKTIRRRGDGADEDGRADVVERVPALDVGHLVGHDALEFFPVEGRRRGPVVAATTASCGFRRRRRRSSPASR